ncbi:MAG: CBS domain-containing protein [Deltaproteobacteria bacterium]|nr:CBS domain-containing protein [Deltaproteobacteria bacterium]
MLAKDIMTKKVITVSPLTTVKDLAKSLTENDISGVPVADKTGKLLGIVSATDIVAKGAKQVKAIMSRKVISVTEDTPVEEIANLFTTHKINRVPVLRGKKLIGIVSRADLVRAIAMGEHIAMHTPIYDL